MTRSGAAHAAAGWLAVLLGFSIPLSTALDGILLGLLAIAWLAALPASFAEFTLAYARVRATLLAALLFAMLLIASAWSAVPLRTAASFALKYIDLLLIPIFIWAASQPRVRERAFVAFACAVVLNLAVSYGSALALWEWIPGLHTHPGYPTGFRLSVTHSVIVALGAYAFLLQARDRWHSDRRAACAWGALAALCIHNVLFIVIGRTGYVVLAALLACFALTIARGRRMALAAALAIVAVFAAAYMGSSAFSYRVHDIASDLTLWRPGAGDDTSVGQRVGYYATTARIIREHPLTGVGTGGFARAYADAVRGTAAPATTNPHNDYLMIAAQAGVPAALLLAALYIAMWRSAATRRSTMERDLLRGLVIAFAIAGLFNSVLLDHAEGLLFAWAAGLMYARDGATAAT